MARDLLWYDFLSGFRQHFPQFIEDWQEVQSESVGVLGNGEMAEAKHYVHLGSADQVC